MRDREKERGEINILKEKRDKEGKREIEGEKIKRERNRKSLIEKKKEFDREKERV